MTEEFGRGLRQPALVATLPEPVPVSALSGDDPARGFADRWWEFLAEKGAWEDTLCDLLPEGADYDRLGTDDYDASLEIHGASDDLRLSTEMQEFFRVSGFVKVYVNHKDGWQTHYSDLQRKELPVRGWRRRYVCGPSATTTNVIVGDANPGYYEISYWPEGWGATDWLSTGYMRIVPDPLDPLRDRDASLAEDASWRLSGEAVAARAGTASPKSQGNQSDGGGR